MKPLTLIIACSVVFFWGCSADKDTKTTLDQESTDEPAIIGAGGTGSQLDMNPDVGGTGGEMAQGTDPVFSGADCPTEIGFAEAAALANVVGHVDGSNVRISFDPLESARDYRVYRLPPAGDVSGDSVQNATYRCAGNHAVPFPARDDGSEPENPAVRTRVASTVQGFARAQKDATLGYVFTTPAEDRIPVYALGDADPSSDNVDCYFMRWPESRVKRYTTSETERDELLAEHWRDDGIAFYVPKDDAADTHVVYAATADGSAGPLYFATQAERSAREDQGRVLSRAFSAYSSEQPGSEPLMRVFYDQACARGHDELAAGVARFDKAYLQGAQPVTELHFSGLDEETVLVVEALDDLCPFQGVVAPMSRPARVDEFGSFSVNYPAFQTPDELRAASPTGEVFINGQGDGTTPRAIARACVRVTPSEPKEMDFRYTGTPETFSAPEQQGFQIWTFDSPTFDVQYHTVATDEWSIGSLFGELWVTYGDWAADTNGKLRVTPKARAELAADSFVHATMEVDTVSTQRRYPQILISDQEVPVQDNLENGSTVLVQTFGGITMPVELQIQFCDHRTWDVNNQCPMYDLYRLNDGEFLSPRVEINGVSGVDRTVLFDVYASTERVYVYTNGKPYGCVDLPADRLSAGPATVTYGDVLYHSGVDLAEWYPFHVERMHNVTSRHFSNLAFSSGVSRPDWDEARIPCVAANGLN